MAGLFAEAKYHIPWRDPEALQQHENYGIGALLDPINDALIAQTGKLCSSPSGTFDETAVLQRTLFPDAADAVLTPAQQSAINLIQLLRRATRTNVGRDYADLVYEMCRLIVNADGRAAVALGVSHDMLARMKVATGGIDPDTPRFPEVIAVHAVMEKLDTTHRRGSSMASLAAALMLDWVDTRPDYYRIFVGPQEPDGRVRDNDQCSQANMLGLLVEQLFLMSSATGSTAEIAAFRTAVARRSATVAEEFPSKQRRLVVAL